ncbi:MAG TPA: DUF2752 domain-containing protein [Candidatus Scybalousia intestinigallinarum]|nr:DUF2752 domain-containing protein [Candidatus Scybalousia intestinigallinarum]
MRSRVVKITILGIGSLSMMAIILWLVDQGILHLPCFFYQTTGMYCPGCGMTRAILTFLHGEYQTAFYDNALLYFLLPFFFFYGVCFIFQYVKDGKLLLLQELYPKKMIFIGLIVVVLFGILRNCSPFSFLRPI